MASKAKSNTSITISIRLDKFSQQNFYSVKELYRLCYMPHFKNGRFCKPLNFLD